MSEIALPERGRMFKAATIGTLALGGAVAWLAIYHFAAPEPVVVETPPVIKVVKQIVRVPAPAPLMPTPAPAVLHTEPPPVTPPKPEQEAPPPPSARLAAAKGDWDGIWQRDEQPLPMFRLIQSGDSVSGMCDVSWGGLVPFKGGTVKGDVLQFIADDSVFRAHFRLTMTRLNEAKVEMWVSADDWETSLERANRVVRTPQQAAAARAILMNNARKYRKPVPMGVFIRQEEE